MAKALHYRNGIIAFVIVAATVLATAAGVLRPLERVVFDAMGTLGEAPGADAPVTMVVIDEAAIEQVGPWPWPRDRLARLNERVHAGDPAAVGLALALDQPQYAYPLRVLDGLAAEAGGGLGEGARRVLAQARQRLGTDAALGRSLRTHGATIVGADFRRVDRPATGLAPPFERVALDGAPANRWPLHWLAPRSRAFAGDLQPPVEPIAGAAAGVGLLESAASGDGAIRLARTHAEAWLPSFALLVYAQARGVEAGAIGVERGHRLRVGERRFATGPGLAVRLAGSTGGDSVRMDAVSAADVLAGSHEPTAFTERSVVVGLAPAVATEAAGALPPAARAARVVAGLHQQSLVSTPPWAIGVRAAVFALVLIYLALAVPRLGTAAGWIVTALVGVVAVNAELVTLLVRNAWIPLMAPVTALVVGHAAIVGARGVGARVASLRDAVNRANRALAESHREAGRLDDALRCLRQCDPDTATVERMYGLALDLERRRRLPEAAEAFRFCTHYAGAYRDAAERAQRCDRLQDSVTLAGRHGSSTQALALDQEDAAKPVLGRYQIERELGKGAMGTVFLGEDARIGRQVAIKTMPLDQEFEGQTLEEVKQRFLREAETAGRLSHPNIVTVYDVGEEQDLAYIAMDYLRGTPLNAHAESGELLPAHEVFDALAQVADALATAHAEHVLHRDIKPDNIVYDRATGHVTVTDFGVACLLDERQTRTGTILGSPSYMSPEQLASRALDGRSDLFSLGVTLYQLLSGEMPFEGDSLSSLMYRISHHRHRELRRLRPELPTCATTITNRCLEKEPQRRYASASQLAQALRRCRGKLDQRTTQTR